MEIVLGIEKKMSDEGYKSNISRIAGSGAGSMALAKHAASVTILSPANNTQLKELKKHYGAVAGIFVCGAERQKDQSCGGEMCSLSRGRRSRITGLFETSLGSYEPRKKI